MPKVEITFIQERETKRTWRYQEKDTAHVGTLYVNKSTLGTNPPQTLKVSIEWGVEQSKSATAKTQEAAGTI